MSDLCDRYAKALLVIRQGCDHPEGRQGHEEFYEAMEWASKVADEALTPECERAAPELPAMRYRTIVADPPWHYDREPLNFAWRRGRPSGEGKPFLSYPTMTLAQIAALPVADFADRSAHLYLWTTQRYLRDSYAVAEAWGFHPVKQLIWCKPPTGFALGGTYGSAAEFVLFARRGTLPALTKVPRDWFEWSRGAHSAKPEAFLDLVEQVSPGPRLELFARRQRLGWDTWGNEALEHVAL